MELYSALRPLLFACDAETAHGMGLAALKIGAPFLPAVRHHAPKLEQTLWNLKFPNPLGLAAGFDKNAEVPGAMLRLGFGFVELGTVTPRPQDGNPRPRVFRDPRSGSVINRMGFPNGGLQIFKNNVERFLSSRPRPPGVIGLNIGMNKDQAEPVRDYTLLIRMLGPLADYLTVNISSPNTPGLRNLQAREPLLELLHALREERRKSCGAHPPPLLVKLAPDLEEAHISELAQTALEAEIDGLILTNTTLARPTSLPESFAAERGGLSGPLLHEKSLATIRAFYSLTSGKIPIIGVGGINSAETAYAAICAGASLVQLYTALVFHGPCVIGRILEGLSVLLRRDGLSHISQAVGRDHGKVA